MEMRRSARDEIRTFVLLYAAVVGIVLVSFIGGAARIYFTGSSVVHQSMNSQPECYYNHYAETR